MPNWDARLEGHPANGSLAAIAADLKRLSTTSESDAADVEVFQRALSVVEFVQQLLGSTNAAFVSAGMLDQINGLAINARTALQAWVASPDPASLDNLDSTIDTLVQQIGWAPAGGWAGVQATRDASANMRRSASALIHQIETDADEARAGIAKLRKSIDTAEARLDQKITDLGAQLEGRANVVAEQLDARLADVDARSDAKLQEVDEQATAALTTWRATLASAADEEHAALEAKIAPLDAAVSQLTTTIDAQKERIEEALKDYVARFGLDQDQRQRDYKVLEAAASTAFDTLQADARAAIDVQSMAHREEYEQQHAMFTESASAILEELRGHELEAEALVSKAAVLTVSSGHRDYADEEHKAADRWRRFGIGLVAVGLVAIILIVRPLLDGGSIAGVEASWLTRLAITTPIFLLAIYSFTQSGRHRSVEHEAQETSLKLKALEPYIAVLGPEDRAKIKAGLVDAFFAGPATGEGSGSPKGSAGTLKTIDKLTDAVVKLTDKVS